ncbi:MAG: EscU/YscU/HrcU family type III secretion system export apparatus switch protein [Lachnospiraceae bacterium]
MVIEYNLQFFAKDGPGGEKTGKPTAKKLEDARKEGQVAKSKEISNAFTTDRPVHTAKGICGTVLGQLGRLLIRYITTRRAVGPVQTERSR